MSKADERLTVQVRADEVVEVSGAGLTLVMSVEDNQVAALVYDGGLRLGKVLIAPDAVEVAQRAGRRGALVEWEVG